MLDELIGWYQHSRTDLSEDHPLSLKRKLQYLRKMQSDPFFPEKTQEFLRQTRIEAKRLGNKRHELIHGTLTLMNGRQGVWLTQRVIYQGPTARVFNRMHAAQEIINTTREISDFAGHLSPKVWVISGNDRSKFPAGDIEKALSELGLI